MLTQSGLCAAALFASAACAPVLAQDCIWTSHPNVAYFSTSSDSAIYHSGMQRVLLIRKSASNSPTSIWSWDGAQWTLLDDAGPMDRGRSEVAYDSARDRLVLFGGIWPTGHTDTWEWVGNVWIQHNIPGPPPRRNHAMAYDESRQRTVLFGGFDTGVLYNDTWEWDGQQWLQVATSGPSTTDRFLRSFEYDPIRQRTVLYSYTGPTGSTVSELWDWNGATWERQQVIFPFATARFMVFDTIRDRMIFSRGNGGTWELDPTTLLWAEREPTIGPTGPAAFDPARSRAVALHWNAGPEATYEYNGAATGIAPFITEHPLGGWPAGSTAVLEVTVAGTGPFTYQWRRDTEPLQNGGAISGVNTRALTIDPVGQEHQGMYDVVISNQCATTSSNPVVVVPHRDCYADCDGGQWGLNIDDFTCFINEFAYAQGLSPLQQWLHYVNCDQSSTPPVLNVDDFMCFINEFATGCP